MTDERDAMLDRVVDALRPLPRVDESAKARLLVAVAAERERDRESAARSVGPRRVNRWVVRITAIAAAAALVAVVVLRGAPNAAPAPEVAASTSGATNAPSLRLTGSDAASRAESAVQAVELVLRMPSAANVRVVGDFNEWDKERAPMKRDAASGLWSVTLALTPGRHVYAFVVDDTLWMRDPRAPAAKDADFDRPGSVLLVGRP
ncbi:MAG: isoamylase early set domain-containing protein [bacterium]